MKKEYTILAPDFLPTHMELLQNVFKMNGYHLEVLHYEGKKVIDTGLKYVHNDMCYPAICTIGQQLYALTCGDYDPHKCALIQFQTGGGCRASNYIMLLRKALENMGMGYVPVISLNFMQLEKQSGFKLTPFMILQGIGSLVYGDMLLLLKNQTMPYEKNKGDTKAISDKWVNIISKQLLHGKGITGGSMKRNLSKMAEDFHNIERVERKLTKVGIVGEIYVKYSSFGNNNLEKFLSSQGCEYMIPGVLGFFQFGSANGEIDYKNYGGSIFKRLVKNVCVKVTDNWEENIINAVKKYKEYTPPLPFSRVEELASRVIDLGVKMGEGWLLPGEVSMLIELGYNNVICAQPFGCLPNHIVGKGTIRRLREIYPQANIFPVDYDSGASGVNQENRIRLMLAMANEAAEI